MEQTKKNHTAEYNGHCAFAVSLGKMDVEGSSYSSTIGGKTYSFSNPIAKILFRILPSRVKRADENWIQRGEING
ncbi:MAG: hypothetical protein ACRBF0_20710 [Calditrichia bacterium]